MNKDELIKQGWAIIDGFPHHRVTTDGRVQTRFSGGKLTAEWRDMAPDTDRRKGKGYKRVCVIFEHKHLRQAVHRLVAKYFVPNPENKPQVNHINGLKSDNRFENLEWVTARENIVHAVVNGLNRGVRGSQQGQSKLNDEKVIEIKRMIKEKIPQHVIGKHFGVHQMTISKINVGRLWKHVQ